MKEGEVALSAIRRKVTEETGFDVASVQRLGNAFCGMGMTRKEHFYFVVELGQRRFKPDDRTVETIGFFTREQVRMMIINADIIDERSLAGFAFAHTKGYF